MTINDGARFKAVVEIEVANSSEAGVWEYKNQQIGGARVEGDEIVVRLDAIPINGTFSLKIIRGGK